jgi:hypothetical protein
MSARCSTSFASKGSSFGAEVPVVALAGLKVAWKTSGLGRDFGEELLGSAEAGGGEVDLQLDIAPVEEGAPSSTSARPIFFHGPVQVSKTGAGYLVDEGRTRILIDSHGVHARLDPEGAHADLALRVALFTALRSYGVFELHAGGARGPNGDRVLVCGESGAGKTTFVLACLRAGWAHLGDDTVLLRRLEDRVVAFSFPRPFLCTPRTLESFSLVGGAAHAGKSAVDPGERPLASFEPSALLFPVVSSQGETTASPVSQAEALGELIAAAPLVAVADAPGRAENLSLLRELAHAPALRIALGADLLAKPAETASRVLAWIVD